MGDVGNTLSDESDSDEEKAKPPLKKRKIHISSEGNNCNSDTEDSDCQIIEYIPPKIEKNQKNNTNQTCETLYQNQLMDRNVANLFQEDLEYDGDNKTDKEK